MSLHVDIEKKLKGFHLKASFSTKEGCLGILGASGCGKSMTLKAVAGIIRLDKGYIENNGEVFYDWKKKIVKRPQKRKTGFLFQNYALFPNMTVEENIIAGLGKKSCENRIKARRLMEQFRLAGLENRYPGALSGGQQQRCALARILICNPQLLLLDEPFSALDAYLKEELQLELKEILKSYEGASILVTHDRDEAYRLCSHLMVMEKGQVIETGPTKELFQRPKTFQAARLTGCKNLSKAVRIGENRVQAVDWDVELSVLGPVREENCYIGIRAHDFKPWTESMGEVNRMPLLNPRISESPFEENIIFNCNQGSDLWWKIGRDTWHFSQELPRYVCAPPEKLMVLA